MQLFCCKFLAFLARIFRQKWVRPALSPCHVQSILMYSSGDVMTVAHSQRSILQQLSELQHLRASYQGVSLVGCLHPGTDIQTCTWYVMRYVNVDARCEAGRWTEKRTNREQTDGQTDRRTAKHCNRQKCRATGRATNRQTNKQTDW